MSSRGGGRRGRPLSPEEKSLWRQVVRTLEPLPGRSLPSEEPEKPADPREEKPAPARKPMQTAAAALRPPPSLPALAPLDRRMRQKVARGKADIDARIDLHGMTQDQAHSRLRRFLAAAQGDGLRLVLVITGKGGRSGSGEGVLRRMVPLWLERPECRRLVIGFEEAHAGHGGAGALYVRIRRAGKGGWR
ncbi:DNA-nicking Smr family endonuclease [Breoghania corrubedonensis]|uniref:DNA-nicking Smr family endonuclease n=1 Tax=Breoghania corrubedonensis TaxID=665038 RepID=A0A2T5VH66_9HYPH|nr:Smr/MutS family protein [Breoghania corrubedonensis]PTW63099.1 DNA-nicking Smr family endonuclease [Breoghania corrubedonensis]